MRRSFIREILENTTTNTISFAGGLPSADVLPIRSIKQSAINSLNDTSTLQYGLSSGDNSLKEKIANIYTKEGFKTTKENILITSGSQQALDIISRYYPFKGITIEKPSYLGAINIFKLNSMKIDDIPINKENSNINLFDKSINKTKLAYLIPDFQNPSTYTYSQSQREDIANSILKNNAILIEDSPYSELYFNKKYKSISSLIKNNSYHLGSFSKILAPGLRIGYIRASKKLLEPLIAYKEAMDLHTSTITQAILNDYLNKQNQFNTHKESLRTIYKKKERIFRTYLDEILPEFIYTKPKGGMFIYGRFNHINTSVLVQKCLEKGVVFVPGNEFYMNNLNQSEIRFNFTSCSAQQIYKGLNIIKSIIKEQQCKTL